MDVAEFVLEELPPPPSRVLEVGCGSGKLAEAMANRGHEALGIDPEAPSGSMFRRIPLEDLDDAGPFDAVVASRALHHIADLGAALDRVVSVVRPAGVLVLDDFAWERLDAASADSVGIALDEWREEHGDLHTSEAMLSELGARFAQRSLSWEPYLYRESRRVIDEKAERELIAAGRLAPIGFRYVGRR